MSDAEVVRVTTTVSVDPDEAFRLFTDEVDAWWRSGPRFRPGTSREGEMRFEGGVGGRFVEVFDDEADEVFVLGRIVAWEPGSRLVFELGGRDFGPDDPPTEVEIVFAAVEGGTRVVLEQRGWEEIPADHPARHGLVGGELQGAMGYWWGDLLVGLRDLAKRGGSGA
ncbi:MAG: SRPBCC domain-containing protein [Myxococcota bacterium]|nr:SRPBCC domain-containing protein [Myxococcota bacterium]